MISIIETIKSDPEYQKDPLVFIANLTCHLIQEIVESQDLDMVQEVSSVISFGELLLYSCLSNLQFDDPKEIEKIYNIIHENYERSECRLRQSMAS